LQRSTVVKHSHGSSGPFAATLVALLVACGSGIPVTVDEAQPLAVIGPREEPAGQFDAAVRRFARDTQLERATPSDVVSYAGVQSALQELADAIVLMPKGAEVLLTRDPAGVIRRDAVRVGAGVLDNTGRTKAVRHALSVAAETLEAVARGAYPNVFELSLLVFELNQIVASIDDSQLLFTQRPAVARSFEQTLAILQRMQVPA
jgi:hypothetical protein